MSSSDEIDSGLSYNGLDNLFDSLKASLELGKSLNYQNDISSSEKCIGEFLSHTSESIKDIKNAVKNHYKHKKKLETTSRNLSYKKPNILPQKKYFEVIIENLLEKGKIESIFANKIAKNKGDVMLDHLKT